MSELPVFKKISATFKIDKQAYFGVGIASAEAILLVITQSRSKLAAGMAGAGGLVGGLIGGAIAAATAKRGQPLQTCTVADLDDEIRDNLDWPLRGKRSYDKKQVFIIPRDWVDVIEHPKFTNLLKFDVNGVMVTIEYLLFRGASIRDYLLETGWTLKWRGTLLEPAARRR